MMRLDSKGAAEALLGCPRSVRSDILPSELRYRLDLSFPPFAAATEFEIPREMERADFLISSCASSHYFLLPFGFCYLS